uniref:SFRICE_000693 n=1 Tax=Spodoptera frugiperda TaxID=7108 RepID=A0A2H1V080_SPOFR
MNSLIKPAFSGVTFIKSRRGQPLLLLDNYTYNLSSLSHAKGTNRWTCTSRPQKNCRAKVILNAQQQIVSVDAEHNHPPREYHYHNGEYLRSLGFLIKLAFLDIKFIKSRRGQPLILLNNYTYNLTSSSHAKGTERWICTSRPGRDCRAKIILNSQKQIVTIEADHNHPPPKYLCHNGITLRYDCMVEAMAGQLAAAQRVAVSFPYETILCVIYKLLFRVWTSSFKFIKSKTGRPLILMNNYTYSFASLAIKQGTKRWLCSSQAARNCKAKIILNVDQKIVSAETNHNHAPPKYICINGEYIKDEDVIKYMTFESGKILLLFKKYTYWPQKDFLKNGTYNWMCSCTRRKNCKAKLVLNKPGFIVEDVFVHNHDPPRFYEPNGFQDIKYMKFESGKTLILYKNYSYWHQKDFLKKGTYHWMCSSTRRKKCKAKLVLDKYGCIVLDAFVHNHEPPRFYERNGFHYKRTVLSRGLAHWICTSSRSKNCKARMVLNSNSRIDSCNLEHNHEAPSYRCVRGDRLRDVVVSAHAAHNEESLCDSKLVVLFFFNLRD